jgi:methionine aminotransferase
VLAHPELRARSVAVYSFGKTLHATGLRVGYAVAPAALTAELRKVHQFNTFTITTFVQQAIADYLREHPACGADLPAFFQLKRDRLAALLEPSGWQVLRSAGSYFQLVDYSALSARPDVGLVDQLIDEAGVASIPLSVFYREPPPMKLLRLCFAKRDETLVAGARRLADWAARQRTMA